MIERYSQKNITWIDLREPTAEEVREVMEECNIEPELMSDFTKPVPRSGILHTNEAIKITFDFPVVKRTDIEGAHEIKCVITKDHIVTARYEDITAVHKFAKEFEVMSVLKKADKKAHAGHIFIALITQLYAGLEEKLDYLESRMRKIETEMINQREREMVVEISDVARRLISFNQTLVVHDGILAEAPATFSSLFGKDFECRVKELHEHYHYIMRRVTTLSHIVDELRDTNTGLLTTKQNEIMKILTIMAFVTFPLTLFASLFGMNTEELPIVGHEHDFLIILSIMGVATILFFVYFKYKRWI